MDKNELDSLARRYSDWEVATFIIMHMRKAAATSLENIRSDELAAAKMYYEVLGHKIAELTNV